MSIRLHSTAGDGVLGRHGDLIVLCSAPEGSEDVVDQVLAAHDEVAQSGGDGSALADRIAAAGRGVDYIAFAPTAHGLAISVVGHAWAVVATEYGEQRLALPAGHEGVRSVLPGGVRSIRAGLGDIAADTPVLRWNDLHEGTVRAGSLLLAVADDVEVQTTSTVATPPVDAPPPMSVPAPPRPSPIPESPRPSPTPEPPPPLTTPEPPLPPPPPHSLLPEPYEPVDATPPPPDLEPDAPAFVPAPSDEQPPPLAVPVDAPSVEPAEAAAFAQPETPAPPPPPPPAAEAPAGPPQMASVAAPNVNVDRSQPFASVALFAPETPDEPRAPLPVVARPAEPAIPDAPIPANPVADDAVEIIGVYCKNGHFDDPSARYCAICGISMAQQTLIPRRGPRPPLGVLVLDDGSIFSLDTDYVIGRDPSRDPDVVSGAARPLRIDDPEGLLSRVHARIHLDGWSVQVIDLGSANGTGIWGPDDTIWQRAPVNTAQIVRPGTQVGVGRRQMRYESHRNT